VKPFDTDLQLRNVYIAVTTVVDKLQSAEQLKYAQQPISDESVRREHLARG